LFGKFLCGPEAGFSNSLYKEMALTTSQKSTQQEASVDVVDRRIIVATQAGLPLTPQPYHQIAEQLNLSVQEVMSRLRCMMQNGVIRRIGLVPNHYALGYRANGMSVWDVPDAQVQKFGGQIGELEFVSHCYHRPRHLPHWPYNLFAMVHGRDRAEVNSKVSRIARLLGACNRGHTVLYSTRILKKTGLRLHS
jgi:DNA-binding Lrp family transcriptional regulator